MKRLLILVAGLGALLTFAGCFCPGCPIDSADGVGVAEASTPRGSELGAMASVVQLLAVGGRETSPEVRAIDSALSRDTLVVGTFHQSPRAPHVRGYAVLKDGRIAIDRRLLHAAPPDATFLAHPKVWPLVPFLYAAGHRLAHGGTWESSVRAAAELAPGLAADVRGGAAGTALPAGTNAGHLAEFLERWERMQ